LKALVDLKNNTTEDDFDVDDGTLLATRQRPTLKTVELMLERIAAELTENGNALEP
jgi:hypothetical protein